MYNKRNAASNSESGVSFIMVILGRLSLHEFLSILYYYATVAVADTLTGKVVDGIVGNAVGGFSVDAADACRHFSEHIHLIAFLLKGDGGCAAERHCGLLHAGGNGLGVETELIVASGDAREVHAKLIVGKVHHYDGFRGAELALVSKHVATGGSIGVGHRDKLHATGFIGIDGIAEGWHGMLQSTERTDGVLHLHVGIAP